MTKIDGNRKPRPAALRPAGAPAEPHRGHDWPRDWLIKSVCWAGAALFVISLAVYLYAYLVRFGRPAPPGPVILPAALDVGLFTLFAAHHSVFARAGIKQWIERVAPAHMERSIYTWAASLLFLLVCLAWQPVPGLVYTLDGPAAWLGFAGQGTGLLLIIRASAAVDVLDLAGVRQALDARAGRPPRHVPLEKGGAYALVRHPIYFGWALFVFGAPEMTATRLVFAAVSTTYLAMAVPWEERGLVAVFGDEYRAYQRKVRWRMLPGIY